jgi:hypothetical protein
MMSQLSLGLMTGFSLGLLAAPLSAQGVLNACPEVNVLSFHLASDQAPPVVAGPATIQVLPIHPLGFQNRVGNERTIVITGPLLGSMDSPDVKTEIVCTEKGLTVSATISRMSNYPEATLGNTLKGTYPWRPRFTISIEFRQPTIILQTSWIMRMTNGDSVTTARTPPYPEQKYPITVTKTIRAAPGQKQ